MAEVGARQLATLSFNKSFCRIIYLVFIVHAGHSLDFDMPLVNWPFKYKTNKFFLNVLADVQFLCNCT